MGKVRIEVDKFICERCKHEWIGRISGDPIVCPQCKTPYWNRKTRVERMTEKIDEIDEKLAEKTKS